jgi:hypothetical protein
MASTSQTAPRRGRRRAGTEALSYQLGAFFNDPSSVNEEEEKKYDEEVISARPQSKKRKTAEIVVENKEVEEDYANGHRVDSEADDSDHQPEEAANLGENKYDDGPQTSEPSLSKASDPPTQEDAQSHLLRALREERKEVDELRLRLARAESARLAIQEELDSRRSAQPLQLNSAVPAGPTIKDLKKAVKELSWRPGISSVKLSTYLHSFEDRIASEGGTPQHMVALIGLHLAGQALEWHRHLPPTGATRSSWTQYKIDILKQFQPKVNFNAAFENLRNCKKASNETYQTHLLKFNDCHAELEPLSISNQILLNTYLDCLDKSVAYDVRTSYRSQLDAGGRPGSGQDPLTVAEVCVWAASVEEDRRRAAVSAMTFVPATAVTNSGGNTFTGISPNYKGKKPWSQQGEHGIALAAAAAASSGLAPGTTSVHPSHVKVETTSSPPVLTPTAPRNGAQDTHPNRFAHIKCYNCQRFGHYSSKCPQPPNPRRDK